MYEMSLRRKANIRVLYFSVLPPAMSIRVGEFTSFYGIPPLVYVMFASVHHVTAVEEEE